MIDRRALSLLLLCSPAAFAGCASEEEATPLNVPGHDEGAQMLFVSPMGEPFRAMPPAPYPVDIWFKGADRNSDGKLDLDEFLADAERFFHVLDINRDGVIDHREIFYYEHRVVPEMLGQNVGSAERLKDKPKLWLAQYGGGGQRGGQQGPPEPAPPSTAPKTVQPLVGAAVYNMLADPEPVQGCDIRLTGLISLGDFKTRGEQRFRLLDDENKGYLTLAGLPETEAQKLAPKARRGGPPRHRT